MTVTNTAIPVISGTPQQGHVLTTDDGSWTFSLDYLSYAYQWLRCDVAGANCVPIGGAASQSYLLTAYDVGHTVRSEVTATEHNYAPAGVLTWAPPTAGAGGVAVVNWTMTNANRMDNALLSGGGRDLVITSGEVLTGPVQQLNNWRHVIWIAGEINIPSGDNEALPFSCTGTVHLEGLDIKGDGVSDATMTRGGSSSAIVQIENCRLRSHFKGGSAEHADNFQTQGGTKLLSLRFDMCTLTTDYQGMFLRPPTVGAFVTGGDIRRTNYRGISGDPAQAWLFIADEDPDTGHPAGGVGPVATSDVWMDQSSSSSTWVMYPDEIFSDFKVGGNYTNRQGIFRLTDGISDYWRPSTTSDTVPGGGPASGQSCLPAGWTGIIRIGIPPGGDWCPAGTPGMSYVSPGYA